MVLYEKGGGFEAEPNIVLNLLIYFISLVILGTEPRASYMLYY